MRGRIGCEAWGKVLEGLEVGRERETLLAGVIVRIEVRVHRQTATGGGEWQRLQAQLLTGTDSALRPRAVPCGGHTPADAHAHIRHSHVSNASIVGCDASRFVPSPPPPPWTSLPYAQKSRPGNATSTQAMAENRLSRRSRTSPP